jgi:hypothetical protein
VQALLDHLVAARLLVVHSRDGEEPAVEIVHESLISTWPALRRWREESTEDSAFLEQLRSAARQWESRGEPAGLLWRGEAMEEALRWDRRHKGPLAARERRFLDEVIAQATRAARLRRALVGGAIALLIAMVAAAAIVVVVIRDAEQTAQQQRALAEQEAGRARSAEATVNAQLATIREQLATIERKEAERERLAREAATSAQAAAAGEQRLELTYDQLETALAVARKERRNAERAAGEIEQLAAAERAARKEAERLLAAERERVRQLEEQKQRLSRQLR